MSVLVEALSLIVPRKVLDVSYPGGTDAFMLKMCEPDVPSRLVCADERLVSVSFLGPDEAQVVGAMLLERGVVAVDDHRFVELAWVDQHHGPTMPCDWLEWQRHRDGFTYCWLAGTEPGDMHAPANWTREQSPRLERFDIRDEPGRCLKLADEDGRETWLDFQSGTITEGVPQRVLDPGAGPLPDPHRTAMMPKAENTPTADGSRRLLAVFREMLDGSGYKYQEAGTDALLLRMHDEHGSYTFVLTADDDVDFVGVIGSFGPYVPVDRRSPVAEAVARINMRMRIGSFDLDFDDGELRFRIGMDVEGAGFSRRTADNMLSCAVQTMGFHQATLMRVAFGGAEPKDAVEGSA